MVEQPGLIEQSELSLDTAGAFPGIAISRRGVVLAELNWRTNNSHSGELIPAIEYLLERTHTRRESIYALFVNKGPGSYAGLRVGLSTAMGLALALGADILALCRLDLDAYPHAAYPGPVCAVHQAGRGDVAWAVYGGTDVRRELRAPRIGTPGEMIAAAPPGSLFCGELAGLEEQLLADAPGARLANPAAASRRAATLATLGWERYAAGARDNPVAVEPLYLREPNITQPKQRAAPR